MRLAADLTKRSQAFRIWVLGLAGFWVRLLDSRRQSLKCQDKQHPSLQSDLHVYLVGGGHLTTTDMITCLCPAPCPGGVAQDHPALQAPWSTAYSAALSQVVSGVCIYILGRTTPTVLHMPVAQMDGNRVAAPTKRGCAWATYAPGSLWHILVLANFMST